jgi:adenosine deaminase
MLSNKMDLRVAIITFVLNSKRQLNKNILEHYFSVQDKIKFEAKNDIYKVINSRCTINNYDEIDLLVNKYHKKADYMIDEKNPYLYYYKLISKIGDSFLSHRDGKIILKYWDDKAEIFLGEYNGLNKIAMWNTLSREVNIDTIVFQYMLDNGINDYRYLQYYHSLVHTEDLQLERVLSKGVAETHMHIGAGINFEVKWHDLMNTELKQDENENYKILDICIGEGIENNDLKVYRYLAIIYRVVLSKYIFSEHNSDNICEFLENYKIENEKLSRQIDMLLKLDDDITVHNIRNISKEIRVLMDAYKDNRKIYDRDKYASRMNKSDFLSSIIKDINPDINTTFENIFIFESLRHIRNDGLNDQLFCNIFYKYLLIKNMFFRVSTQDNAIKGLDRFSLSFKRSTNMLSNKNLIYLVIHTQVRNRNLEKIEIRSSFPESKKQLKQGLKEFFKVYLELIENEGNNINIPKIGVVYSFKRYKDKGEKCWLKHTTFEDKTILYYEKNRMNYLNQLNELLELREEVKYLSNYIVGIDASSIENNTEPWVFAPIFKEARNSKRKIGLLSGENNIEYDNINTLGFTFHVGEEFRHILSGLRRIDEVIEHLKFKSGDRIGHGIALGIDVNKWVKDNSIVVIPRIECLENLLWIWSMLTQGKTQYVRDINYVERKIINLAEEIYVDLKGINIYTLYKSYISKFEETRIGSKFNLFENCECNCNVSDIRNESDIFCSNIHKIHRSDWDSEKIFYSLHCSKYLDKMNEPIEVVVEEEDICLLEFIQKEVKKKIAREGIIVETNPTSNRSIGELDNIFEHYISNLNNIDKFGDDNIMVSINTDDPCVFNTNINNEYSYIFYSLLKKGYDRNTCLEWIDKVRKTAIEHSFIKTRYISNEEMKAEIEKILEQLD